MAGEIRADFNGLQQGVRDANGNLQPPPGKGPAGNIDPRLGAAMDDTDETLRNRRRKVSEKTDKSGKFGEGVRDIDEDGAKKTSSAGGGKSMPSMPSVPASGGSQGAAPSGGMPAAAPPSGLVNIDPNLLQQLVEASNEQGDKERAHMSGDAFNGRSATTPQDGQPLDVSQVSLEKYGSGTLSPAEIDAVIDQAATINGIPNDPELRAQWHALYQHMAANESGGNPDAANDWDSNAVGLIAEDGSHSNSSRGLFQCIPSTFAAYHMGGTSNSIYDPVASCAASMNYVMSTYKVSPDGVGLMAFAARQGVGTGGYQGY